MIVLSGSLYSLSNSSVYTCFVASLFAFVWCARCRARAGEESGITAERQTASRQSGQGPTRKVAGELKGISGRNRL